MTDNCLTAKAQRRLLSLAPTGDGWRDGQADPPMTEFSRAGRSRTVEIAWVENDFDWRFAHGFRTYDEDGTWWWIASTSDNRLLHADTYLRWRPLPP